MVAAESSPRKTSLSRNQVPYQWIDIEQDAAMRELVQSLTRQHEPVARRVHA
jgi:hypothetical protein